MNLIELKNSLTLEELFVIYLILRDTQIGMFDTAEDAVNANNVYKRLREYFNSTDYEDQVRAF